MKDWMNAGNKLQYDEVKKLNSVWKKDYLNLLLKQSPALREYVQQQVDALNE